MGFYQFDPADAERFARFVGIRTKARGNELVFYKCPYCGQSTSDKDKFAINLKTGQFNCLRASCGVKGNMLTLSKDFAFSISDDVDRYLNRDYRNNTFRRFEKLEYRKPPSKVVEYLGHRGISKEICEKYEIVCKKGSDSTLVFPFKDEEGTLKFIKYRDMNYKKDVSKGSKEWCEKNCMPILFGMNHCEDFKRLIITEGQIDSLSCVAAGLKNAVSVPTGAKGTTWIPHCYNWVQKFDEIVVFGDSEKGHITLVDMISNRFGNTKVRIVRVEDYLGEKDANDILIHHGPEAVRYAVDNAETVISRQVQNASEIEDVDMDQIPKIKTGYTKLDEILKGGFMYGQVILLTGKRGNGKSTMASQFICEALNQEKNCFIYSGELPSYNVKGWLDMQLTGREHPTRSQIDECNKYYDDRLFIYNNQIIESEDLELKSLLEVLEDTIKQKDIKFALIDNLMTAIDAGTNETLYRRQSEFVAKLAKLSKVYNMVIMLIAHPRKSNNGEFDNDDVSGSADITNRVDVVMSYDKDSNRKNMYDLRILNVTKNRLTGKLGKIDLWFSDYCKRISDRAGDFSKHYLKDDGFVEIEEKQMEVIPF